MPHAVFLVAMHVSGPKHWHTPMQRFIWEPCIVYSASCEPEATGAEHHSIAHKWQQMTMTMTHDSWPFQPHPSPLLVWCRMLGHGQHGYGRYSPRPPPAWFWPRIKNQSLSLRRSLRRWSQSLRTWSQSLHRRQLSTRTRSNDGSVCFRSRGRMRRRQVRWRSRHCPNHLAAIHMTHMTRLRWLRMTSTNLTMKSWSKGPPTVPTCNGTIAKMNQLGKRRRIPMKLWSEGQLKSWTAIVNIVVVRQFKSR